MTSHHTYMKRALHLAAQGLGFTSPNPAVGAVIVKNGKIVGRGYHKKAGAAHAEIVAIQQAGNKARDATLYVTLEPCNHFGRTPPCSPAIVRAGIKRVFYAIPDSHYHARNRGAKYLQQHGLEVIQGPCTDEARHLNRFFFHRIQSGRPYVIAKFATSLDGKIATSNGESQWITGSRARQEAHYLRRITDAVLVGSGTVLADNPSLTSRKNNKVIKCPLRIVLDSLGQLPTNLTLFTDKYADKTILATTIQLQQPKMSHFRDKGTDVVDFGMNSSGMVNLPAVLNYLGTKGINSLLVEGGSRVLGAFAEQNLIDEVWGFLAPMVIGGEKAPGPFGGEGAPRLSEVLRLKPFQIKRLGQDILLTAAVRKEG